MWSRNFLYFWSTRDILLFYIGFVLLIFSFCLFILIIFCLCINLQSQTSDFDCRFLNWTSDINFRNLNWTYIDFQEQNLKSREILKDFHSIISQLQNMHLPTQWNIQLKSTPFSVPTRSTGGISLVCPDRVAFTYNLREYSERKDCFNLVYMYGI